MILGPTLILNILIIRIKILRSVSVRFFDIINNIVSTPYYYTFIRITVIFIPGKTIKIWSFSLIVEAISLEYFRNRYVDQLTDVLAFFLNFCFGLVPVLYQVKRCSC